MILNAHWEISELYCDPASSEYISQFRKHGLNAIKAKKDVHEGIECVAKHLHPGVHGNYPKLMVLNHCANVIEEFKYYHWREVSGGVVEDPDKSNDHCMDALRYAVYSHTRTKMFRREPAYQHDNEDNLWAQMGVMRI